MSDQTPLLRKAAVGSNGRTTIHTGKVVGIVALASGAVAAATVTLMQKTPSSTVQLDEQLKVKTTKKLKTMREMDLERGSAPTDNTESPWPGSHEVLLYKRTMPTKTPAADCEFMTEVLGFQCSYMGLTPADESGADTTAYCGARAQGTASMFSVHLIRDMFHPLGVAEAEIEKIDQLHDDMTQGEWDPFMTYSVANFVPDLTDHVEQWNKLGINYRAHTYLNTADSKTMYVGIVAMPSTGAVFEMHSLSVDEKYADSFVVLPDEACAGAVDTGFDGASLHKWWTENKESTLMNHGVDKLPDSIMVKITHPTTNTKHAADWMLNNAGMDFAVDEKAGRNCETASAVLKTFSGPGYAKVSFVDQTKEYQQTNVLTEYVQLIEGTHANWLGTQKGWDRFMDNHIGLVFKNEFIDALAPKLVQNSVRFHAHQPSAGLSEDDPVCSLYPTIVDQCGSIWTEGVSGLGIEMHGLFDYSFFEGDFYPSSLDFCHVSSSGDDEYDDTANVLRR
jgi:hypothetical protein